MPELLRLQTPDFELSVWASDISTRSRTHQKTLAKRAGPNKEEPELEIRFEPEATLVDASSITGDLLKREMPHVEGDNGLLSSAITPEKCATLALDSPLFFENIQYQFEWVFFVPVTDARLAHHSQIVNDAFRFAAQRGSLPARLTGSINTGNDVGWMRLPLQFTHQSKVHTQHIAFEVFPTKMALHQDLSAMYKAIDEVFPLWRFSLVEKTEQNAERSRQRGHFPLMWLTNFGQLRARFEQGLKVICAAPHSRLQPTVANSKACRLKGRLPHRLGEKVKQDIVSGKHDKRYRVENKQLSVDTPENRFIKMAVSRCKRQLAELENKLRISNRAPDRQRLSEAFLNELHRWQLPMQKVLSQSFIEEVGHYSGRHESLVLQQKTGYSAVYRVWQELKFYLNVFGSQSSISMKSVAEIYEVWCFLCVKQILEQDLGFALVDSSASKLSQNDFFEYQLKDGFAGAFKFERTDGVTARLAHEPIFSKKGQTIRSYLVNQEPDIVLEVTLPATGGEQSEKQFIWLFDAKYRIKTADRFGGKCEESETSVDYVPDDAINQMHRYRDALIHLSTPDGNVRKSVNKRPNKSRPVFGAFALYPGFFDQANEPNPYAAAIEEVGIGAFALLPTQANGAVCGHIWLLEFLQAQIGSAPMARNGQGKGARYPMTGMAERLSVQEAARIPYYGMRQVLYQDLTLTVALGGQRGREGGYFDSFAKGTAHWYHLPQKTFLNEFKQHVVDEIRYLAIASTSETYSSTKKIDKLWPIKKVSLLPRYTITKQMAGKASSSDEPYYLFELGRPLTLQTEVTRVPHQPISRSMRLTTLTRLENISLFSEVEPVYQAAMVLKK